MVKKEHFEYPEHFARFYDVIYHKLRTADHDFFLKKIKEAKGKVLEIGVGTGRFFMEALNSGADIYGLDISPSMIRVLKEKLSPDQHFRVQTGDAVTMKKDMKFKLILAPFRVLSHITETRDQLRLLNTVYDHLDKDGIFIFDLFVPDPKLLHEGIRDVVDFEGEYEPGKKLKRTVTSVPDIVNQILDITMQIEWEDDNRRVKKDWNFKMRFYFRYEIDHLVSLSKLKMHSVFGDYHENPLNRDSKEFIVVCGKE